MAEALPSLSPNKYSYQKDILPLGLYVEEKGKIYIRIKDVVKVGVLAEKQMEDVENCQMSSSSSSPCPFGECEISVSRLLPIFGGSRFRKKLFFLENLF